MTRSKYWFLFLLQTTGAIILLWRGVPFYRSLLLVGSDPGEMHTFWAWIVLLLIQPAYWLGRISRPTSSNLNKTFMVLGHFILFLSRLTFIFVGSVFTVVFYNGMAEFHIGHGLLLVIALLFSMFCYTMELENIGTKLIKSNEN